ncbi:MAG: biopolymer transporter ExbD [Pseudomonadota bacterium]
MNTSSLGFKTTKKAYFATKLNLVALMDIFTILVFFLLLNSGDSEKLENAKFVTLPDSSAGDAPHAELILMISDESIWLDEQKVVDVKALEKNTEAAFQPLREALVAFKQKRGELSAYEKENGLSITIMGDEKVTYDLLQWVMTTCRNNDFRDISLAVNRVAAAVFSATGNNTTTEGG